MFVQISPSEQDLSETLSSLNFATRVRGIDLGPARKQIDTSELQKMKGMLDKARQESRSKDESLRKLEENLQNLENKAKGKDQVHRNQQEKIKELEGQLEMKTALHNQSEKQASRLSDRLKEKEETCSDLQQKVKELQTKLRERQLSDSAESVTFQQKVKELENKLREQMQESETQSFILRQKVKELERQLQEQENNSEASLLHHKVKELEIQLKEQDNNSEVLLLHQKIKELEDKLREQETQLMGARTCDVAEVSRASPNEGKARIIGDGLMGEIEPHILRSSNSVNRPLSQGSALPRGNDVLQVIRKKRQSRSGETENIGLPASSFNDMGRKSDPPKIARLMRPAKPTTGAAAAQGSLTHKRLSRDQTLGVKERDTTKKKIWSR